MITKILDTIISNDLCWIAEQVRDLVAYARHTYDKYYGEPLSEEDIRLFSAGGNPERLTAAQEEFILNRRAEQVQWQEQHAQAEHHQPQDQPSHARAARRLLGYVFGKR